MIDNEWQCNITGWDIQSFHGSDGLQSTIKQLMNIPVLSCAKVVPNEVAHWWQCNARIARAKQPQQHNDHVSKQPWQCNDQKSKWGPNKHKSKWPWQCSYGNGKEAAMEAASSHHSTMEAPVWRQWKMYNAPQLTVTVGWHMHGQYNAMNLSW